MKQSQGGAAILLDSARAEDFNFRDAISSGAGYGFDLGIAYNFNENWRFSLSGQNIAAWITWPERYGQRIQLAGDGEIEFTGFEASLVTMNLILKQNWRILNRNWKKLLN
ncbi:MAG: DUF5723 family protein [Saprospiraceae bacterium]